MNMLSKYTPILLLLIFVLAFPQLGSAQCRITNIQTGLQSTCNPATNTYSQEVIVSFNNPPADNLITINEQTFPLNPSQQGFFQGWITGLPSNGKKVPTHAFFTSQPACSLIISSAFTAPLPCKALILQPTLQDFISQDIDQNNSVDPGDFLNYLARITNHQQNTAEDVSFYLSQLDPNLTIDLNSIQIAPIALPDTIEDTRLGANQIPAYSLLHNDIDPDSLPAGDELSIVAVDTFSMNGGQINLLPNGDVQYASPPGSFEQDEFEYVIMDEDGMLSSATVLIRPKAITSVCYVQNNTTSTINDGSKAHPFKTLTAAENAPNCPLIYVFAGDGTDTGYDMGIELDIDQQLIGEGAGLKCGGCAFEEPAGQAPVFTNMNTTTPTNNGNAIVLAENNTVHGIKIENTTGYAFANLGASVGNLSIDIESVEGDGGILQLVECDNHANISIQEASSSETSGSPALIFSDITGDINYLGIINTSNEGRLMVIDESSSSLTFKNSGNQSICQADPAGEGILIKNTTADITFETPIEIGTATTPNGGDHGITLFENNTANYTLESVDIHTQNHTGIWAEDNQDEGLIIINDGTIISETAPAILIGQMDVGINLTYVKSTDSPTDGVAIKEGTGYFFCEELEGENIGSVCNNLTVTLDNSGSGSLIPSDLYNGIIMAPTPYSNTLYSFAASPSTFTTADIGPNTVSLTVMTETTTTTYTDIYTNVISSIVKTKKDTISCSAIVTVEPYSPPLPPLAGGFVGRVSVAGPSATISPASHTGSGGCTFDMSSLGILGNTGAQIQPLPNGPAGSMALSGANSTTVWIGKFTSIAAVGAGINVSFPDDASADEATRVEVDNIDISCGNNCRGAGVIGNNVDNFILGEGEIETYKNDGVRIVPGAGSGSRIEMNLDTINTNQAYGLKCTNPNDSIYVNRGCINVFKGDTAVYLIDCWLDVTLDRVDADSADVGIVLKNTTGSFTVVGKSTSTGSGGTICNSIFGMYTRNAENISLNYMNLKNNIYNFKNDSINNLVISKCSLFQNTTVPSALPLSCSPLGGSYQAFNECVFQDNVAGNFLIEQASDNDISIAHSQFLFTQPTFGTPLGNADIWLSENDTLVISKSTFKGYTEDSHISGCAAFWDFASLSILEESSGNQVTISGGSFQDNKNDIYVQSEGSNFLNILNIDDPMAPGDGGYAIRLESSEINQTLISGISEIDLGKHSPSVGIQFGEFLPASPGSQLMMYGNNLINGSGNNARTVKISNPILLGMKNNTIFYNDESPSIVESTNADSLCAAISGNTFIADTIGFKFALSNTSTSAFKLERGNNLSNLVDSVLATQNMSLTAREVNISGTITPVADATCITPAIVNDTKVLVTDGFIQEAAVNKTFQIPLEVTLLTGEGAPISGATVTFAAPVSGPSCTLSAAPLTDARGVSSVTATANSEVGWYDVTVTYGGKSTTYHLRNRKR